MDVLKTNGWGTNADGSPRANPIVNWSDRMLTTDLNYGEFPIPYEDMFDLAALIGKDSWGCIPQSATDDHINQYVLLAKAKLAAPPGSPAGVRSHYCGLSNETWNFNMPQYKATMSLSQADPDPSLTAGGADINIRRYRWMGKQVMKIAIAAMAAYGVKSIVDCPIRPVLDGQWGNPDILRYGLQWIAANAPAGLKVSDILYGIAIAPYAGLSPQQILDGFQIATANAPASTGAHVALANQYGLRGGLLAYECGFDAGQGTPGLPNKIAAAYLPAIRPLVKQYLTNWQSAGGGLACWFTLTCQYTKYGQWGLTEDLATARNAPKYEGAEDASAALTWDDAPIAPPPPVLPPPAAKLVSQETVNLNDGTLIMPVTVNLLEGNAQPANAPGATFSFSDGGKTYSIETLLGTPRQQP